jgi:tetratricopeptide (TPR) repeat protein
MVNNKNSQKIFELYKQGKINDALIIIDKEILVVSKTKDFRKEGIFIIDFEEKQVIHDVLDRILELNPKDSEILARKCVLLELEMKHENAKKIADEVLNINSRNKLALQTIGTIYFHNEEFEKALDCYEKILAQDKNNSTILFCKAIILELIGKDENTISPIFKAFDFDSLDDESLDSLVAHLVNSCGLIFSTIKADKTLESEPKNKLALKIKKLSIQNESKIRNKISELFIKHLHRNADLEGLDYYEKKISEGRSFQWIEENLANSEEGKNYWN